MCRLPFIAVVAALALILACGGAAEHSTESEAMKKSLSMDRSPMDQPGDFFSGGEDARTVIVEKEVMQEVVSEQVSEGRKGRASAASNGSGPLLQIADRKVISTASVSLEVEAVQEAAARVRTIAESAGGFVEHLTSGGGPLRQRATITVRVPQTEFSPVLLQIEGLGSVQDTTQGSEDVSERFIDLKARLDSALREEKSLLALLERASAVSEVLAIERELARVRSDIERSQGQLNFLERRVALAAITVTLSLPPNLFPEPPAGTLSVETPSVEDSALVAKELVTSMNGAIDRVVTTVRGDSTRSSLSVRVFPADFLPMMDFLEGQGRVDHKQVEEGSPAADDSFSAAMRPEANIDVVFFSDRGNPGVYWTIGIAAALAGLGLAAGLAYRLGSRRGRGDSSPPASQESRPGAEG